MFQEKFEDNKVIIRRSMDILKNEKKTNNNVQNTTQEAKDQTT